MKNLTTFYNNNILDPNENVYLYFKLGDSKYAVNIGQVVEIMKLPLLDYPQKLPNNIIGLLDYNDFTINILDLRFYLNIKVTPYSLSNQLLIVKTDEAILGLLIDKVEDVASFDTSKIEYFQTNEEDKILDFMYKKEDGAISVINLGALENIFRRGVPSCDIDIPSLFPHDDDSRYKLIQRSRALQEKFNIDLVTNIFSQDRFISFSLDGNIYCINLEYIKEFLKNFCITPIPCNLDYVAGVIALKGDFITIINIKKFLDTNDLSPAKMEACSFTDGKNNIIILEFTDFKIGFLVDEIFSIINIPEDLIKKNPLNHNKYILSEVILEDKFYTILDIKNILSDERFFIEDNS